MSYRNIVCDTLFKKSSFRYTICPEGQADDTSRLYFIAKSSQEQIIPRKSQVTVFRGWFQTTKWQQ